MSGIGTKFYIHDVISRAGHTFKYSNLLIDFWCLTPLSAIFQLYHGDQF